MIRSASAASSASIEPKCSRERLGVDVADPGQPERVEHDPERPLLRALDLADQRAGRDLAEALQLGDPLGGEVVDRCRVGDQALVQEAHRVLLAEALDVHGAAEVLDELKGLARAAAAVGADRPHGVLGLHGRRLADRALLGRLRPSQPLALAPLDQRRDHLRDHVAGARDDHLVALAGVLARQVLLVVEGGGRDRHPSHVNRLQHGERKQAARATDVPDDPVELRRRGDRRELPGHRPAWLAAGDAELTPQRALVDLDHHSVDLVVERLAPLLPPPAALDDLVRRVVLLDLAVDLEPVFAQPLELLGVAGELDPLVAADPVAPDRERPRGGDPGVELADRAGGRVAGVGERRLAGRGALLVELGERAAREVDLAADLDSLGRVVDPQRDRPDRAQVLGHVLADHAVAARRAADELAALVEQRDRDPVDLRLGDEAQLPGPDVELAQAVVEPRLPGPELLRRCGRWPARASAPGGAPARTCRAARRRRAGSANRGCEARGAPPRAPAARRAARRRRRRRSRDRRGRSSGDRDAAIWRRSSSARLPGLLAAHVPSCARHRGLEHLPRGPSPAAGRGPRDR